MRIIQYLPNSLEEALVGIEDILRIVGNDFTEIAVTKEKLSEKDYIEIFGTSKLNEHLPTIVKYIIEVK